MSVETLKKEQYEENEGEKTDDDMAYETVNKKPKEDKDEKVEEDIWEGELGPHLRCQACGHVPCVWRCNREEFLDKLWEGTVAKKKRVYENKNRKVRMRLLRNTSYKILAELIWGRLGYKNLKEHFPCVVREVRKMFPCPDGRYIGFKVADGRNKTEGLNTNMTKNMV